MKMVATVLQTLWHGEGLWLTLLLLEFVNCFDVLLHADL